MSHPKYDHQLIVGFLSGQGDAIIKRSAATLTDRARAQHLDSPIVEIVGSKASVAASVKTSLGECLRKLTAQSRLYLMGHGDHELYKLGGWKGEDVADLLKECGLPNVAIISITGCKSSLGPLTMNQQTGKLVDDAFQNFAARFHFALGTGEKPLKSVVYARVFNVQVISHEQHFLKAAGQFARLYDTKEKQDLVVGRKITRNFNDVTLKNKEAPQPALNGLPMYSSKQTHSKRRYYWQGEEQRWEWVAYDQENVADYLSSP